MPGGIFMQLLGEMLVQLNLVPQDVIDKALRIKVGGNRRLGHILVQMRAITADQLAETLSKQLNVPICDIAGTFSSNTRKTIPRYLCRQYGVLPLSLKDNNILEMAMADPADEEAIRDLEQYTGRAIETRLARHSDIYREIPKRIPFAISDVFSPRSNTWLTRIAIILCLVLIIPVAFFTYKYIHEAKYGTISVTTNSIIYKNHDLMLAFDKDGKINLFGHAAYASSYYSVSFKNPKSTRAFLESRKSDLSDNQKSWLDWVITTEEPRYTRKAVAANN